jgi:hypothetical protein
MVNYPTRLEDLVQNDGGPLVCHGCAHSVGNGIFPNAPSGERPCFFCKRNARLDEMVAELTPETRKAWEDGTWTAHYDNSKTKEKIADRYISTDRLTEDVPDGSSIIT